MGEWGWGGDCGQQVGSRPEHSLAGLVRKTVAPALSHLPLGIKDFIVTLLAFCQAQVLSSSCRPNSTPRGSQLPHQCKDTRMRDTVLEREAKRRGGEERGTLFQLRAGPGTGPWGGAPHPGGPPTCGRGNNAFLSLRDFHPGPPCPKQQELLVRDSARDNSLGF